MDVRQTADRLNFLNRQLQKAFRRWHIYNVYSVDYNYVLYSKLADRVRRYIAYCNEEIRITQEKLNGFHY